jgi:BirA family biotin operon repressor/biotin-[acetyl-CoA-carboxylase] ligase
MATPYVTIVRNVVGSTQDLAVSELARSVVPVLVVAHEQTTGRGRSDNEWWQATRGIAASLAFGTERFDTNESFPLSVGLAVRAAVAEVLAVGVQLKWPNDLEVDGRKVGGILVERTDHHVVVGCGLNLYWPEAPGPAGGLLDTDPGPDRGVVLSHVWAGRVLETEGGWDHAGYLEACSTIGAEVTWRPDGRGTAVTIDDRGGLVVNTESGRVTLRSGEVHTVRPTP